MIGILSFFLEFPVVVVASVVASVVRAAVVVAVISAPAVVIAIHLPPPLEIFVLHVGLHLNANGVFFGVLSLFAINLAIVVAIVTSVVAAVLSSVVVRAAVIV